MSQVLHIPRGEIRWTSDLEDTAIWVSNPVNLKLKVLMTIWISCIKQRIQIWESLQALAQACTERKDNPMANVRGIVVNLMSGHISFLWPQLLNTFQFEHEGLHLKNMFPGFYEVEHCHYSSNQVALWRTSWLQLVQSVKLQRVPLSMQTRSRVKYRFSLLKRIRCVIVHKNSQQDNQKEKN